MPVSGVRIPLSERAPSSLTEGAFQGDHATSGEQDAFDITGEGVINFLECTKVHANNHASVSFGLEIDGVEVWNSGALSGISTTPVPDIVADFSVVYPNGIPFSTGARGYLEWSVDPGASDDELVVNYEVVVL